MPTETTAELSALAECFSSASPIAKATKKTTRYTVSSPTLTSAANHLRRAKQHPKGSAEHHRSMAFHHMAMRDHHRSMGERGMSHVENKKVIRHAKSLGRIEDAGFSAEAEGEFGVRLQNKALAAYHMKERSPYASSMLSNTPHTNSESTVAAFDYHSHMGEGHRLMSKRKFREAHHSFGLAADSGAKIGPHHENSALSMARIAHTKGKLPAHHAFNAESESEFGASRPKDAVRPFSLKAHASLATHHSYIANHYKKLMSHKNPETAEHASNIFSFHMSKYHHHIAHVLPGSKKFHLKMENEFMKAMPDHMYGM